jgi:hypothetical protein
MKVYLRMKTSGWGTLTADSTTARDFQLVGGRAGEQLSSAMKPLSIQPYFQLYSAEGRQLYQVVFGHTLERFSGLAPGSESADDHKRVESFFPQ